MTRSDYADTGDSIFDVLEKVTVLTDNRNRLYINLVRYFLGGRSATISGNGNVYVDKIHGRTLVLELGCCVYIPPGILLRDSRVVDLNGCQLVILNMERTLALTNCSRFEDLSKLMSLNNIAYMIRLCVDGGKNNNSSRNVGKLNVTSLSNSVQLVRITSSNNENGDDLYMKESIPEPGIVNVVLDCCGGREEDCGDDHQYNRGIFSGIDDNVYDDLSSAYTPSVCSLDLNVSRSNSIDLEEEIDDIDDLKLEYFVDY